MPLVRKVLPWSLLLMVTVLPVLGGLVQRQRDGWYPESDDATIVLLADDTLRGDPPLVGMISTGGAHLSDPELHHPGPLELYLIAPITTLLGPELGSGLAAALITVTSVAALVAGLHSIGGRGLAAAGFVTSALVLWGIGGDAPTSVWNPHVVLLPFACFLVNAAATAAGRRWALVGAVGFGTFVAQTHLSYAGLVGLVAIWLVGLTGWALVRRRWAPGPPEVVALIVGLVLWLPPVIDQVRGEPGNLGQIWRSLTGTGDPTVGSAGVSELGRVAGVPLLGLRPRGELIRVLSGPSPVGLLALGALMAALSAVVLVASSTRRRPRSLASYEGRRSAADLVAVTSTSLVALVAGCLTAARIPLSAGIQYQYYGLWMWPLAGVVWTFLLWAAWAFVPVPTRDRLAGAAGQSWSPLLLVVAVLVASALPRPGAWEPWTVHRRVAGDLAPLVDGAVTGHGAVLVRFRGATPYLSTGSAIVTAVAARGAQVYVDPGAPTPVFPWREHRRHADQAVARELWVVGGRRGHPEVPPGAELLGTVETLDASTAARLDRRLVETRRIVAGGVRPGPRQPSGRDEMERVGAAVDDPEAALGTGELAALAARGLVSVRGIGADDLFELDRMRALAIEGSVSLYLVTAQ